MQNEDVVQVDFGRDGTAPHCVRASTRLTLSPPDHDWVPVNNPPSLPERNHPIPDSVAYRALLAQPNTIVSGITSAETDGGPTAAHLETLRKAMSPFLNHSKKLSSLRKEVLYLRHRAKCEWQACARNRQFVQESHAGFLGAAKALRDVVPIASLLEGLHEAEAKVQEDHERQDKKAQETWDMETKLEHLESKMELLEAKVEKDVEILSALLTQRIGREESGPATMDETDLSSAASQTTSLEIPPLLQHYLDKVGDMKLERENLFDLDQQHQEEKVARQLLQDREESPQQSDEDFESSWLQVFAEAEVAFVEASKKAERAREYCIADGIDPEAYRKKLSRSPQYEVSTPLPPGTPVAAITPSQWALERREDAQTPSEHDFFFGESRTPATFNAAEFLTDALQPAPDRHSPRLERVVNWIDSFDCQPVQELEDQDEIAPNAAWDDERQPNDEDPIPTSPQKHAPALEPKPKMVIRDQGSLEPPSGRPEARSRSISDISPIPSVSEMDQPQSRRPSKAKREYLSLVGRMTGYGYVKDEDGEERPAFYKRTSSESELLVLKKENGMAGKVTQKAWDTFRNAKPGDDLAGLFLGSKALGGKDGKEFP